MTTKVFIDGEAGTTGLEIRDRLAKRKDITLVSVDHALRKDPDTRRKAFAEADIGILCLPDAAAIEAVTFAGDCRIIDASTAHRIDPNWTYGMPELPGQAEKIAQAQYVANVGCYATGSIALIRPLREAALIDADAQLVLTGVSGYSGGGNALIAEYEPGKTGSDFFLYGASQSHKHVPEIMQYGQLTTPPLFQPSVGAFAQGMIVQLHLTQEALCEGTKADLEAAYDAFYQNCTFTKRVPALDRIVATKLNGTNKMEISVHGNEAKGLLTVTATLDNLGKGASGTAIQNLNLMIGADEAEGL